MAATFYITGVSSLSASVFAGGVSGINGRGATTRITFGGIWAAGDKYSMQLVTPSVTYQLGTGILTGVVPTMCMTLDKRVHFLAGTAWYGSDNNDATGWETQAPGAFKINLANNFDAPENQVSLASYQGRMAVFSNNTIQIYVLDANPLNISLVQVLNNIGTFCPLGPESIGDLDVIFPSLTGFRSLRVRDSSLGAFVNDLGSPVDLNLQADIAATGFAGLASTCGIVEPSANRYMFFINGHFYVLSYFPAAKINAAWSQYTPTFFVAGVATTFVPVKMVLLNQQVFILATVAGVGHVFCFGYNTNGTVAYDATVATMATTWMDFGLPGVRKQLESIDYAITGAWQISYSMDYYGFVNNGATLVPLNNVPVSNSSFQLGQQACSDDGFHLKIQATCATAAYSVLSSFVVHDTRNDEK